MVPSRSPMARRHLPRSGRPLGTNLHDREITCAVGLPIGGLKEKILGAERAGITRVLIPKDNEADLEDLPEAVRAKIEVFPVEELGEVLALTLRGASFREGRLLFGEESPRDVQPLSAGYQH